MLALSQGAALLILFVLLPLALAPLVIWFVQWRSEPFAGHTTSSVLSDGEPVVGELLEVKRMSGPILDARPMVRFRVSVDADSTFELEITQAIPRALVGRFRPGMDIPLRISADQAAGAVDLARLTD